MIESNSKIPPLDTRRDKLGFQNSEISLNPGEKANVDCKVESSLLEFSFCEQIGILCCCGPCISKNNNLRKKKAIVDITLKRIQKLLDVRTVLHMLEEQEKLKYVLFNENQYVLLHHIKKETLTSSIHNNDCEISRYKELISDKVYLQKAINEMAEQISKSKLSSNLSNYDKKILRVLEPKIKKEILFGANKVQ